MHKHKKPATSQKQNKSINKKSINKRKPTHKNDVINLKDYLRLYEGLEFVEVEAEQPRSGELIPFPEWIEVCPDGSEEPFLKLDFPEMGYVTYKKLPP